MEVICPEDLTQCLSAMAGCISRRNWQALARFYAPTYAGRRGAARYLTAEEEITRLRQEIDDPKYTETVCCLTPWSASVTNGEARLEVAERLELSYPGGCCQVTLRRFEQQWTRLQGHWVLAETERIPRSEVSYHQPRLLEHIAERVTTAREQRELLCARGTLSLAACLAEVIVQRSLPSPRLVVKVDTAGLTDIGGELLQRACSLAAAAWNQSLEGIIQFDISSRPGAPAILIRGYNRPVYGDTLGATLFTESCRRGRGSPVLAEVRVSVVERAGSALYLDPVELFYTVCHELGHCLGLGECAHEGSVMAPRCSIQPCPSVPFVGERQAVGQWLYEAHRFLSRFYPLTEDSRAGQEASRTAELGAALQQPISHQAPSVLAGLEVASYAPPTVRYYWMGNARLRCGDLQGARESYDCALAEGNSDPELLLQRGYVRLWLGDRGGVEDLRQAVQIEPSWFYARTCLADVLRAYGCVSEAAIHSAIAHRLTLKDELERWWIDARVSRSVWDAGKALMRAAATAVRYVGSTTGKSAIQS
jgi:hypothetical protein